MLSWCPRLLQSKLNDFLQMIDPDNDSDPTPFDAWILVEPQQGGDGCSVFDQ
jgi:hypothetical protein